MSDASNKTPEGFATHIEPEALNAMIEMAWASLTSALPEAELRRVRGLLAIVRGAENASVRLDTHQRAVVPNLFFPGLRAQPWHDPATFPWIGPLEGAADVIREEFHALGSAAFVPYSSSYVLEDPSGEMARPSGWNSFYFVSNFSPIAENLRQCPRTAEALAGVPVAKEALFSVLDPGARAAAACRRIQFHHHVSPRCRDPSGMRPACRGRDARVEGRALPGVRHHVRARSVEQWPEPSRGASARRLAPRADAHGDRCAADVAARPRGTVRGHSTGRRPLYVRAMRVS